MVRWRPRAMGRATPIEKGMSHITVDRRGAGGLTMGQKTHPYGFRLNVIRTWSSKWYEDKHYARWLHEDLKLRERDPRRSSPTRASPASRSSARPTRPRS